MSPDRECPGSTNAVLKPDQFSLEGGVVTYTVIGCPKTDNGIMQIPLKVGHEAILRVVRVA